MRFYFCFGILLCFISLIIGMPSSGGSTSNIQGDSSGVNNNKDSYPISTFYANYMKNNIEKMVDNDEKTIQLFIKAMVNSPHLTENGRSHLNTIIQWIITLDDKKEAINACTKFIRDMIKPKEDDLKKKLCAGDPCNKGTITQDHAKTSILESQIFLDSKGADSILEFVITNNLNLENQVLYKDLLENFGTYLQKYEDKIEVD